MTDHQQPHDPTGTPTPRGSEGVRGTLFRADTSAIWAQKDRKSVV